MLCQYCVPRMQKLLIYYYYIYTYIYICNRHAVVCIFRSVRACKYSQRKVQLATTLSIVQQQGKRQVPWSRQNNTVHDNCEI